MKTLKSKLIVVLAIIAMVCASFMAITAVTSSAQTNDTATTVSFAFEQGASVRMVKEDTGLRFRAMMSTDEYTALEENTATYSDVSYGMIIVPSDFHKATPVTKDSVFGASATYTTVKGGSGTYVINLTSDILYDYFDEEANQFKCFSGVITNILPNNQVREFVAVSYIKYTPVGGTADYVFTDVSDARSVVYVSQIALQKNVEDTDGILAGFVSAASDKDTTYTVEHYLEGTLQTADTETLTAKIGSKVTATAKTYTGYSAEKIEETEILANGKTVIKINYVSSLFNILSTEADLTAGNMYVHADSTGAKLEYEAGKIGDKTGVFKWTISNSSITQQANITYGESILSNLKAGKYLYVSFYLTDWTRIFTQYDGGFDLLYAKGVNSASTTNYYKGAWTWYDQYGSAFASNYSFWKDSTYLNQWITLEYQLPADISESSKNRGISVYTWANSNNTTNTIYIADVKVSGEKLEVPKKAQQVNVLVEQADLTAGNLYIPNSSNASLTYVEGGYAGKTDVFAWTLGTGTTSSTTITQSTAIKNKMTAGTKLYIDFYFTERFNPMFIMGSNSYYFYNNSEENASLWNWYDKDGEKITDDGQFFGNTDKYFNQWLTLEFTLDIAQDGSSNWRGLMHNGEKTGKTIYIANVRLGIGGDLAIKG